MSFVRGAACVEDEHDLSRKRLYVLDENNPYSLGAKIDIFEQFRKLSDKNIETIANNLPNKFYEYKDFTNITNK